MRDPAVPFQFSYLSAEEALSGGAAFAIQRMIDQRMDGLIVRGLFSAEVCARAAGRVAAMGGPRVLFGGAAMEVPAEIRGRPIVGADRDLRDYLADGAAQRERVRGLFDGAFEARVEAAFSALAGGLPVEVARGLDGRTCPSATIRVLPDGGEVGIHVGNDFVNMPAAAQLRGLIDMTTQLSYFVTLSAPDAGGELVVYDLEWGAARLFMPTPPDGSANLWYEGSPQAEFFKTRPATAFAPGAGDLLVFDGGRYFHRVSKVRGAAVRRTIGGFLGLSRERDKVYYWS